MIASKRIHENTRSKNLVFSRSIHLISWIVLVEVERARSANWAKVFLFPLDILPPSNK